MIDRAGHWFLNSGIQEASGGVARYYRSDLSRNAAISTEITGYAVSTLLFLHQRTGDSQYLEAALRAGRFLTGHAWNKELRAFSFEWAAAGGEPGLSYFFDCGIIVRGLLSAWRVTRDIEFLDTAVAGGRAMLSDFPSTGGIHPILTLPDKRPRPWEPRWSATPGCYQLKSALAWQALFEITGETAFERGYESVLDAAIENDRDFLPGEPERHRVMDRLHAYCYFLEGLLQVLDRAECAVAFRNGIERVSTYLREIAPAFARSDVYAQLLRARLLGEARGALPLDEAAAAEEAEQAAGFQIASGGFLFGRKQSEDMPFINPVSTAFCLQALAMWDDRNAGRPLPGLQELI